MITGGIPIARAGAPSGSVESIDDRRSAVCILFIATASAALRALAALGAAPFPQRFKDTRPVEWRSKSKPGAAFFVVVEETVEGATEPPKTSRDGAGGGAAAGSPNGSTAPVGCGAGAGGGAAKRSAAAAANALVAGCGAAPQPPW